HRICYNNDTIVQVGCILVFFMNLKFATLFSVSKCGNKGTVGGIKIVQKTLMKGQAGTNQSRNYRLIGKVLDWRHPNGVSTSMALYSSVWLISYAMTSPRRSRFLRNRIRSCWIATSLI